MVAAGFAIGYFAYKFALPVAGSLAAIILAIALPILWWLFAAGSVADAINAIIPVGIAPVESRDFGGFMLAILLGVVAIGVGFRLLLGPVGWALAMSGNERTSMYILLVGATLNLVLNLVLIPLYGVIGAAVGTTIATFSSYFTMAVVLRAQTGIATWPFQIAAAKQQE